MSILLFLGAYDGGWWFHMGRRDKAEVIFSIQKTLERSLCGELFLQAVEEVFDSNKIIFNKAAFACTREKVTKPNSELDIMYMTRTQCCAHELCLKLFEFHSQAISKVEELNKFLFKNELNIAFPQEIIEQHFRSYLISPDKFFLSDPELKLRTSLEDKIISYVKKQLSKHVEKYSKSEWSVSYEDYVKVDIQVTVKAELKKENELLNKFDHKFSYAFEDKEKKEIYSVLDKACFSMMTISNYVEELLEFNDSLHPSSSSNKNGFILLLLKILDKYSELLLRAEEINKDGELKASSYLDGTGKRIVAIQNRLKFFLNNKDEKMPSNFAYMLNNPTELKKLKQALE